MKERISETLNRSLIHVRDTRTWTGKKLHLEYYLVSSAVMGGCAESYGVEIKASSDEGTDYAGIENITMTGTKILELIDLLAAGTVTPTGLADVVQDWL